MSLDPFDAMSEAQLAAHLRTEATRLGYRFGVEQTDSGQWHASFVAPAENLDLRPLRSTAEGADRRSALSLLAYVIANPGRHRPAGGAAGPVDVPES